MPPNADSNSESRPLGINQLTMKFMGRKIKLPWFVLFTKVPKREMLKVNRVINILTVYGAAESFEKDSSIKIKLLAIEELEGILNEMKVKLAG